MHVTKQTAPYNMNDCKHDPKERQDKMRVRDAWLLHIQSVLVNF